MGHRGTGKSAFLSRLKSYYNIAGLPVLCIDLDQEIEKREGISISKIFYEFGEHRFREMEARVFRDLDKETRFLGCTVFLALGGGFPPTSIPKQWTALWLRRASDRSGRIFLDRPRLEIGIDPLMEFTKRRLLRDPALEARADIVLEIQEGLDAEDPVERDFLLGTAMLTGGAITVLPRHLQRPISLESWLREKIHQGIRWLELRDDLLPKEAIESLVKIIPKDRILFSFRDSEKKCSSRALVETHRLKFDWPVEWGLCAFGIPRYLSLHERNDGESVDQALARFPKVLPTGTQAKAAIEITNLSELRSADQWQRINPKERILLPRSSDGRWSWYRLLRGSEYSLNFVRECNGTSPDQPTIMEWNRAMRPRNGNSVSHFAAVIGDPVMHSRTPIEHFPFFQARGAPVFSLRLQEEELMRETLDFLFELGLRWAAVTAPLKKKIMNFCKSLDPIAKKLESVNTLYWSASLCGWIGFNTDLEGLRALTAKTEITPPIAVWGGGGTISALRAVLSKAQFYAARTGKNRIPGQPGEISSPETLLWAAGSAQQKYASPPSAWTPKLVLDLSYAEYSQGRAYALKCRAPYRDGLPMFRAQAAAQRKIWNKGYPS